MPLATGVRLGAYEIASTIGAGGPPPFARVRWRANYGEVSPKPVKGSLCR